MVFEETERGGRGRRKRVEEEKEENELIPDARVLPFNLSNSLLALPSRPISPVLLLVTGITTLLAITIHIFSLSSLRTCRLKRVKSGDPESSEIDEPKKGPHLAFIALVGIGFVLSVAASAVERRSVNKALKAWDVDVGNSIGLKASTGSLYHSMSFFTLHVDVYRYSVISSRC